MQNTTASDVIHNFESSFTEKTEIPRSLEMMWLNKAIALYGTEIEKLDYDNELEEFYSSVDGYIINVLALTMKMYYLEREVSRVNKITSIVGKDLSVNGTNGLQKYNSEDLERVKRELAYMLDNLKPSAYN